MRCPARRLEFVLLCGLAGALACHPEALASGASLAATGTPAASLTRATDGTLAGPVVTAIRPNNGPQAGGTALTITGSGFTAGSTVKVGNAPAASVTVNSSSSITATTPADEGNGDDGTADQGNEGEGTAGEGSVDVTVTDRNGTSTAVPEDQFAYDASPSEPWLGLNGNTETYLGPVPVFAEQGVAYDRIGWTAGETPQEGSGEPAGLLARATRDGMIPINPIEYRGYEGEYRSDPRFPTEAHGSSTLEEYVQGFVKTASAILAAYPGRTILFEPINEPWVATTPQFTGAQYAEVIAKLLPAARAAGIPLSSIYVAANGRHWISEMYAARPSLEREIRGWYFHPYGPAGGSFNENSEGVQSLPAVQAEMTSGQNNIIVSEIGFCALDVNAGQNCGGPYLAHGSEAAERLTEVLDNAVPYHEAGWLRALIVYSRNDGGWAMQLTGGALTAEGEALEAFADAQNRPLRFLQFGSAGTEGGPFERLTGFAWLVRLAVLREAGAGWAPSTGRPPRRRVA
jgi:hypothetical protein